MKDTLQNVKYNNGVSFHYFKQIIEQFDPDCSQTQTAALYRLAWMLGNNCVNLQSFMKSANAMNYFIKTINIETTYDVPKNLTSNSLSHP